MTYDAGNPDHVRRSKDRSQRIQARADAGFKDLMATPQGRGWVWSLLEECGMFRTSFDPSNSRTFFNEGMRNIGLRVMADVHRLTPDQYMVMVKEAQTV